MTNPDSAHDTDKATPQVQPDMPSRDDTATDTAADTPDSGSEGRIEDPELRSGQYGPNGSTPPS